MATTTTKFDPAPPHEQTFAHQEKLPKLPIPPLEETCKRYLRALEALQTPHEHEETRRAVQEFLDDPEQGPKIQKKLEEWAKTKARCDFVILSILYEVHLVDMLSSFSPATSKIFGELHPTLSTSATGPACLPCFLMSIFRHTLASRVLRRLIPRVVEEHFLARSLTVTEVRQRANPVLFPHLCCMFVH